MGAEESAVQKQILDFLTSKGFMVVKFNNGGHKVRGGYISARKQDIGMPDIIGMTPDGRFVAIEVKAPGKIKSTSDAQKRVLERVAASGGVSMVVDSLGQVIQKLTLV
jgi:Holliday junction resolvase